MKRIALVIPPLVEKRWTFSYDEIYLGLAYIAAYLERDGHEVVVMDCAVEYKQMEALSARLAEFKADVVALPTVYGTLRQTYPLAAEAKRLGVPLVVAGGLPATFATDKLMADCPAIDLAVIGEGEVTMSEVVSGAEFSTIRGIAYRQGGQIVRTAPRELVCDLDTLPMPARHLFPLKKYLIGSSYDGRMMVSTIMETKRGCPFACEFCVQAYKEGRQIRARSIEHVLAEMRDISTRFPYISRIMMVDNDFFIPYDRGVELLKAIIDNGFHQKFEFMVAARLSHYQDNPDLIELSSKANIRLIYFGVESVNSKNRERLGKVREGSNLRSLFDRLRAAGVNTVGSYIIGFENETAQDISITINQSFYDNSTSPKYNILCPYPGTPLYEDYTRRGLIDESKPLWFYDNAHKVTRHPLDLEVLLKTAYRSFYMRPGKTDHMPFDMS